MAGRIGFESVRDRTVLRFSSVGLAKLGSDRLKNLRVRSLVR
ncbi:hypothetical protein ACKFKG_01180 [Phormidesmis sp. 146-35]